jgi:DNA-binding GntR family transcriptional regulator
MSDGQQKKDILEKRLHSLECLAHFGAMSPDSTSLTYSAYKRLRSEILAGRLPAERKLKIHDLSSWLSVSPSVVREALSRLSAESLVVAEPQRGFRVAPVTAEDVSDLTEVRIDIETKCLRRAMSVGGMAWEVGIVAAQHELIRTPYSVEDLSDEWTEAHAKFHRALVAACDSQWLLKIREQLFIQGERYRRINIRMSGEGRNLKGEHEEIAAAVVARDVPRAVDLMTAHLRVTETLTLQSLKDSAPAPNSTGRREAKRSQAVLEHAGPGDAILVEGKQT